MPAKSDFTGTREVKLYCQFCSPHRSEEDKFFWERVHANDVIVRRHPITMKQTPYVTCPRCSSRGGARLVQIKPKEQEKIILPEKERRHKQQENLEKYARKFGSKAAKTDFIQPDQKEEFTKAFGHDDKKMKGAYNKKELKDMGKHALADELEMEQEINRLNKEGRIIEATDLEDKLDRQKKGKDNISKIII